MGLVVFLRRYRDGVDVVILGIAPAAEADVARAGAPAVPDGFCAAVYQRGIAVLAVRLHLYLDALADKGIAQVIPGIRLQCIMRIRPGVVPALGGLGQQGVLPFAAQRQPVGCAAADRAAERNAEHRIIRAADLGAHLVNRVRQVRRLAAVRAVQEHRLVLRHIVQHKHAVLDRSVRLAAFQRAPRAGRAVLKINGKGLCGLLVRLLHLVPEARSGHIHIARQILEYRVRAKALHLVQHPRMGKAILAPVNGLPGVLRDFLRRAHIVPEAHLADLAVQPVLVARIRAKTKGMGQLRAVVQVGSVLLRDIFAVDVHEHLAAVQIAHHGNQHPLAGADFHIIEQQAGLRAVHAFPVAERVVHGDLQPPAVLGAVLIIVEQDLTAVFARVEVDPDLRCLRDGDRIAHLGILLLDRVKPQAAFRRSYRNGRRCRPDLGVRRGLIDAFLPGRVRHRDTRRKRAPAGRSHNTERQQGGQPLFHEMWFRHMYSPLFS